MLDGPTGSLPPKCYYFPACLQRKTMPKGKPPSGSSRAVEKLEKLDNNCTITGYCGLTTGNS